MIINIIGEIQRFLHGSEIGQHVNFFSGIQFTSSDATDEVEAAEPKIEVVETVEAEQTPVADNDQVNL